MAEVEQTRTRLHISGLTPRLTKNDLIKRLSTFGQVSDEYYDPSERGRWVFVTFESSKGNLRKCLNSLSGSVYKGAKLRIGEAKADFSERIAKENTPNEDDPPTKKRKTRHQAIHSEDMDLITPDHLRPGWTTTTSGKLLRPLRMRPEKPLPPTLDEIKAGVGKRKKRMVVPTRARRQTIDVMRWGGERLSGVFLEARVVPVHDDEEKKMMLEMSKPKPAPISKSHVSISAPDSSDEEEEDDAMEVQAALTKPSTALSLSSSPAPAPASGAEEDSFAAEASRNLTLLDNIFEGADDWDGKESLPSDIDEDFIPRDDDEAEDQSEEDEDENSPQTVHEDTTNEVKSAAPSTSAPSQPAQPKPGLKDLFAPQEESGFSLLHQLDIDIDIDEDMVFDAVPQVNTSFAIPLTTTTTAGATLSTASMQQQQQHQHPPNRVSATSTFNPKLPLFFSIPRKHQQNMFCRKNTEEEIKKRWEDTKVELTAGWKKRWREASKSTRRGRTVVNDD